MGVVKEGTRKNDAIDDGQELSLRGAEAAYFTLPREDGLK
jgi:hypothetical protein